MKSSFQMTDQQERTRLNNIRIREWAKQGSEQKLAELFSELPFHNVQPSLEAPRRNLPAELELEMPRVERQLIAEARALTAAEREEERERRIQETLRDLRIARRRRREWEDARSRLT